MRGGITFSAIIPAWNAGATVCKSIDSIVSQTYPAHQIIVVDDGSTDGTATLLKERYGDSIQLIVLPENCGPSPARNAGLDAANGSHVCFLDADDTWHPEKLAATVKVIAEYPAASIWYHWYATGFTGDLAPKKFPVKKLSFPRLLLSNPIATPCVILPNTSLRFDAGMRHTEDYDYFLRAAWQRDVIFFNAVLTRLGRPLMASGGQSSQLWKMRKGELRSYLHLAGLHRGFILLLPMLWLWSGLKHVRLWLRTKHHHRDGSHHPGRANLPQR